MINLSRHLKKFKNTFIYNKKETENILNKINDFKDKDVVAICNPECIGITNSTNDIIKNVVLIKELLNKKQVEVISEAIIKSNIKQLIFSSITFGYKELIEKIYDKNKDIKIKVLWHGNHSLLVMKNEPYFLYSVLELLERNIIVSIAFFKESMYEFYKQKGYNVFFLTNNVQNLDEYIISKEINDKTTIGIYSAGNRWEKNTFNQLSGVSLIENSVVDIIPVNNLVKDFCKLMNIDIKEENLSFLTRDKLFKRMQENDVNLYITFSECSPMLPLESLQLGIPCLTGNNHHYFKNSKLIDYLVVNSEDDVNEIKEKIEIAIKNKDEIITLYKVWKKDYDLEYKELINKFLED